MCFIPYLLEQVFSISTQQFLKNFIFLRISYPRFVQMYDNNNNNNNDFNKNFIFTSESSRVDDNSTTNEIIRERVRYSKIILTQIIPFRRFIELIKRFPAASPTILISTELQLLPPCSPPSDRFKLSLRCLFLSLSQAGNGKELERVFAFESIRNDATREFPFPCAPCASLRIEEEISRVTRCVSFHSLLSPLEIDELVCYGSGRGSKASSVSIHRGARYFQNSCVRVRVLPRY